MLESNKMLFERMREQTTDFSNSYIVREKDKVNNFKEHF